MRAHISAHRGCWTIRYCEQAPYHMSRMVRVLPVWLLMALVAPAMAQFPSRPVKITMPHSSGVAPSIFMRLVAEKLSDTWGKQVIVENRPGASGFIAIEAVKNAPA